MMFIASLDKPEMFVLIDREVTGAFQNNDVCFNLLGSPRPAPSLC